jgi:hypothetical protein
LPPSFAAATSRIALVPRPKLVNPLTKPVVEVNSPAIPIPAGPSKTAINLVLIMDITILKTWTPPNRDVALKI